MCGQLCLAAVACLSAPLCTICMCGGKDQGQVIGQQHLQRLKGDGVRKQRAFGKETTRRHVGIASKSSKASGPCALGCKALAAYSELPGSGRLVRDGYHKTIHTLGSTKDEKHLPLEWGHGLASNKAVWLNHRWRALQDHCAVGLKSREAGAWTPVH